MRKTKSTILGAVHETERSLEAADVMDQVTLREFDRLCPPPIGPLKPVGIEPGLIPGEHTVTLARDPVDGFHGALLDTGLR